MTRQTWNPQDPLPDPSMVWRRTGAFAFTLGILAILAGGLLLVPAEDVLAYAQGLMLLLALVWLLYFGGASSNDLVRLLGALRLHLTATTPKVTR